MEQQREPVCLMLALLPCLVSCRCLAVITVLWAAAAALIPAMQKGNETARTAHIVLNAANVLLFVSQIPTGLEIVGKVFEFTSWP